MIVTIKELKPELKPFSQRKCQAQIALLVNSTIQVRKKQESE